MLTSNLSSFLVNAQTKPDDPSVTLARASAFQRTGKMTEVQAERTAKDFESMFVAQMMEQMFGDSLGDEMFGDAETNEVYKGLMMEHYGKEIAASGGIGIAEYVKRELLRLQEV